MGQFLYSVYVHSGLDYPGYKEGSLFHGREVPGRVQVCAGALACTIWGAGLPWLPKAAIDIAAEA